LPHRRSTKQPVGKQAVKKLADYVDEMILHQEKSHMSLALGVCEHDCGYVGTAAAGVKEVEQRSACEISQDVHKQLAIVLGMIRDLSGAGAQPRARMPSEEVIELLEQLIDADIPVQLLSLLSVLEFEARTDVMNMCCALLMPGVPWQIEKQVVEYLRGHPQVAKVLVDGYASEDTALHYGVVLRSCARHAELASAFLTSGLVFELVRSARHPSIDISSDAFYTLKEMLLADKSASAIWLEDNFESFFELYNALLTSGEYIVERQAQKLLTEILLDKHFRKVMVAYVSSERHLQIHMNLLKDRSKAIQLEAYHVFKIFVANPAKPLRIQKILFRNKDKLATLLESLRVAKADDKNLNAELRSVVDKLLRISSPNSQTQQQQPVGAAAPGAVQPDPASPPR